MHVEENDSNKPLFENDHCLITAKGEIIQKSGEGFPGRTISIISEEEPEAAVERFTEAFKQLERQVVDTLDSIDFGKPAEELDKMRADLLDTISKKDAVGDFPGLIKKVEEAFENEKKTADEASAEEAPKAEEAEVKETEAAAEAEKPKEEKAEEPVKDEAEEAKSEKPAEEKAESADTEETKAEDTDDKPADAESEEKEESGEVSHADILKEAEEVVEAGHIQKARAFFDDLPNRLTNAPELEEAEAAEFQEKLDALKKKFEEKQQEYQKKQEERREKNFTFREELLARMQRIVDNKHWHKQGEVSGIQRKFDNVRPLPKEGVEDQDTKLKSLIAVFDENRVQYLVEARQKEEENLIGKLATVEKVEQLTAKSGEETEDWEALSQELEKYFAQWRKIGRVPKDREKDLWERYNTARDLFFQKRMDHDPKFKKTVDKSVEKRKKLIEKAKSLLEMEDIAMAARQINKLHSDWKKQGPVPKELNDQLWEEFKAASDAFNERKSENMDTIREQENENYKTKQELCAKAEELANSDDVKGSPKEMEKLFSEWKKVGPVPRKKSNPIWGRFRDAMDKYYKKRRAHFKEMKAGQQENLEKKRELCKQIAAFAEEENPEEHLPKVKELQEQYKQIGFVPIRQKDKIWDTYRKACDTFYNALRGSTGGGGGGRRGGGEQSEERKLTSEIFKLRKEADQLREKILKYSDTMTYFKPNKKGLKLREEIQENIDKSEKELEKKNTRIEEIQAQINELRNSEEG